jgi:hypothetical protein
VQQWYTVEEFSAQVKREPFTVREWCRHGRINAERCLQRCGPVRQWRISHGELERFRRDGLLPPGGVPAPKHPKPTPLNTHALAPT